MASETLVVSFPSLSEQLCGYIACEAIKHIMFMRNQIQSPFIQLEAYVEEMKSEKVLQRRKLSTQGKKKIRCVGNAQRIFESLCELQMDANCKVAICIGSSCSLPKAVVVLSFSGLNQKNDKLISFQSATRQFIRSLVMNETPTQKLNVTNTYILVYAKKDQYIPEFVPKYNWRLNIKRKTHFWSVDVQTNAQRNIVENCENCEIDDYVWFCCRRPIPGCKD